MEQKLRFGLETEIINEAIWLEVRAEMGWNLPLNTMADVAPMTPKKGE